MKDLTFMKSMATALIVALMMMGAVSVEGQMVPIPKNTGKNLPPEELLYVENGSFCVSSDGISVEFGIYNTCGHIGISECDGSMILNRVKILNTSLGSTNTYNIEIPFGGSALITHVFSMDEWNDILENHWGLADLPSGNSFYHLNLEVSIIYSTQNSDGTWNFLKNKTLDIYWQSCDFGQRLMNSPTTDLTDSNVTVRPNPANENITVNYHLEETSTVRMSLFNTTGQKVRDFGIYKNQDAGNWQESFSLRGLVAGIYYLRYQAGGKSQTIKVVKM